MAEKMDVEARIAHFLRLSQDSGATQSERDTAGREAERLLAKHAIDRLTVDTGGSARAQREPIEQRSVIVAGGKGTVAFDLVRGLCRAADAIGLVALLRDRRGIDPWLDGPGTTPHVELVLVGFASDLALAVPLLESLAAQATLALWAWWRGDARHRRIPKYDALLARCDFARSFGLGAAERLRRARDAAVATTGTELLVAGRDAAVRDWVAGEFRVHSMTDRRSFSGYGRGQGYAAGLSSTGGAQRALRR